MPLADVGDSSEIWKAIPNFPEYQISNFGRIMRICGSRNGHAKVGGIRKPGKSNGYQYIRLTRPGGIQKTIAVHVLVAELFLPPKPSPKHQVNHKDSNRWNPRWDNLEWATVSENIQHGYDHGHCNAKGSRNGHSKLTEDRVNILRAASRPEYDELAEQFGITVATIHDVVARRTWRHI